MLSFSYDHQSEDIEAFNSTSRYLEDQLNIDNNLFDSIVHHIYPSEAQLNKANVSDTEAFVLDLHIWPYSLVKLWGNLKQIATKGFFTVVIFLDLHF